MTTILPRKKQKILKYLKNYIRKHGFAPTLMEITRRFKLSSPATVHEHLQYLEKHGFIERKGREIWISGFSKAANVVLEEEYTAHTSVLLPVVGLITAGEPIEAVEDHSDALSVPAELLKRKDAYILKVRGDSMIESCIDDGDYVVVQKQDYASDGDIVVALLEDGSATLKEYHKERNYIRLQPRNARYEPLRVKNVVIQGKVAGIIRKF